MHPGDASTDYWHRRPLRSFSVWHPVSDILKHSNSRNNVNFFSLFFFSRKILTVTFWDFLKTCGGDTYLEAKKTRNINYSLLDDLQVSDIGWFWAQTTTLVRHTKAEYLIHVLSRLLRCACNVRFVGPTATRLLYRLLWHPYRNVCLTVVWHFVWHPKITVRRLLLLTVYTTGATSSDKLNIIEYFVAQSWHWLFDKHLLLSQLSDTACHRLRGRRVNVLVQI